MKILLAAINAKYIHSNLAVYSLQAYARENAPELSEELYVKEYTINQLTDQILMDLYKERTGCDLFFLLYLEYYPGERAVWWRSRRSCPRP